MVRIVINNAISHIAGSFHTNYEVASEIGDELRIALSYEVSGHEWSEKFKNGTWDGRISLYLKRDKSFPTGLLFKVKQVFLNNKIEFVVENQRQKPLSDSSINTTFEEHNRTLRPYQELTVQAALQRGRGVLSVATGGGKALDITTPILTVNRGWTTMAGILPNDVVFDEQGYPTTVLMAHSILLDEQCYKVYFSDGAHIIASEDHLWTVNDDANLMQTLTTNEIHNRIKNQASSSLFIERPYVNHIHVESSDVFDQCALSIKQSCETGRLRITSVERCESVPVRCITVDSPSRLYLVGRTLIPTHNTMISAELLAQMNALPAVFIVPSKTLMYQTQREFDKYLKINGSKTKIGIAGDSVCDLNPDGINVLTWQTALQAFNEKYTTKGDKVVYDEFTGLQVRKTLVQLKDDVSDAERRLRQVESNGENAKIAKAALKKAQIRLKNREQQLVNKNSIKNLIQNTPVYMVDEAHTAAVIIQRLGEHAANSYYRYGVTATAWREDNQEIRIEGTFGRILIDIRPSALIKDGWLVRPHIFMVKIKHNEPHSDYNDAYLKHVVHCWERNYRIKQFAERLFQEGRKVMILVERLEHGDKLEQMVYNSVFVPGKDDGSGNETITEEVENYRLEMLSRCAQGKHILIATQWANVGVDEPGIDTLILAGSNQSSVTTFQQVGRILRPAANKVNAIVIDFLDEQNDLHNHSLKRKRAYALESEFKVYRVQ